MALSALFCIGCFEAGGRITFYTDGGKRHFSLLPSNIQHRCAQTVHAGAHPNSTTPKALKAIVQAILSLPWLLCIAATPGLTGYASLATGMGSPFLLQCRTHSP